MQDSVFQDVLTESKDGTPSLQGPWVEVSGMGFFFFFFLGGGGGCRVIRFHASDLGPRMYGGGLRAALRNFINAASPQSSRALRPKP